ncbi:translin-associated protein X isoform X2 [Protopterus annectens]|uniref:translin-associated protein X isoform X2 n=1 Tax=Protopterus annectens TaxID=7888 RepID=UPI001CFC151B|nr:translin-associated protein X isoform X2 [Protopterus annectens]
MKLVFLVGSNPYRKRKYENFQSQQKREERCDDNSPPSAMKKLFFCFQRELDQRHDKYERLVKLSRDITIESKRTIFLLHRISSTPDTSDILAESVTKLDTVRQKIKMIAQELVGEDMHQYHRAFSPGLQEYVEAVTFQYYIQTRSLMRLDEINKQLVFPHEENEKFEEASDDNEEKGKEEQQSLSLQVTPIDYLLGIADLTGELMRMCINSVGNGDISTPFELSQFLQQIYDGFSYIGNTGPYEVSKKLYTLKQSLGKVEGACYTLKVRGSEIPKHMLADVFSSKAIIIDQDEGIS